MKLNNVIVRRDESFARFSDLVCAFPEVLRDHLREGATLDNMPGRSGQNVNVQHPPSMLVNHMYGILEKWKQEERIHYGEVRMVDRDLKLFLEVCGGCERIRNTPIATSYRVFLNHAIGLFLLTLPWGIVNEFHFWTIPIVFLTSYFIIAIEGIASHIEQPFGKKGDGLNLTKMCDSIRTSVEEIFATETAVHQTDSH